MRPWDGSRATVRGPGGCGARSGLCNPAPGRRWSCVGLGLLSTTAVCVAWLRHHTTATAGRRATQLVVAGHRPARRHDFRGDPCPCRCATARNLFRKPCSRRPSSSTRSPLSPALAATPFTALVSGARALGDSTGLCSIKSVFNLGSQCHVHCGTDLLGGTLPRGAWAAAAQRIQAVAVQAVLASPLFAGINLVMLARVLSVAADVPILVDICRRPGGCRRSWPPAASHSGGRGRRRPIAPALLPATSASVRPAYASASRRKKPRNGPEAVDWSRCRKVLAGRYETGDLLSNFLGRCARRSPPGSSSWCSRGTSKVPAGGRRGRAGSPGSELTATDAALLSCAGNTA